jgi:hypothetical protein
MNVLDALAEATQSLSIDARRFPPPWSIEDIGAAYVVKDSSGQKLGYFYFEEEPGDRRRRSSPETRLGESRRTWRGCPNCCDANSAT